MKPNRLIKAASLLIAVTAFTACTRTDESSSPAPAVNEAPAPTALEVNAPIASRDIDVAFTAVGSPTYDPTGDTITYMVNVANNGKVPIASKGSYPVNIGVVILGADGTLNTPPAKQDFVRMRLADGLAPGQKVDLPVKFKVEPTLGGTVIVDAVQERVAWFRGYGKPMLTLGSFTRCNMDPKTVCTSDGTAIPAVQ